MINHAPHQALVTAAAMRSALPQSAAALVTAMIDVQENNHVSSLNGEVKCTGLLSHETGWWCHPFSRVGINVDHKKRVDLGVLRGADHDGLGAQVPFEMVSVD